MKNKSWVFLISSEWQNFLNHNLYGKTQKAILAEVQVTGLKETVTHLNRCRQEEKKDLFVLMRIRYQFILNSSHSTHFASSVFFCFNLDLFRIKIIYNVRFQFYLVFSVVLLTTFCLFRFSLNFCQIKIIFYNYCSR